MSLDRKTIKQIGKENMRKQWGELLLAWILVIAGEAVASLLTIVTLGIGVLVVAGPLVYGATYMYYRSTKDEKVNQKMLLKGFKEKFGDSFLASILIAFIMIIPFLIAIIFTGITGGLIGGLSIGVSSLASSQYSMAGLGGGITASIAPMIIGFVLSIAALVACLFVYFGLIMTMYILMREPKKTAVQAMKKSWAMTKGLKFKIFVFFLSFIGWFLLSALTAWILLIWVAPYYMSARTVLFNDIYDNSAVADDPEFEFKSEFGDIKGSVGGLVNKVKPAGEKSEEKSEQAVEGANDSKDTEGEYKTCSNCGAKVKAKAKFCNKCGSPV